MTQGPDSDPSPFLPPRAPIGLVRATLGILLCISGILQLGILAWILLTEDFDPLSLLLAFSGIGALAAGWRWSARKPAGLWLLPALIHVPLVLLLVWALLFSAIGG